MKSHNIMVKKKTDKKYNSQSANANYTEQRKPHHYQTMRDLRSSVRVADKLNFGLFTD